MDEIYNKTQIGWLCITIIGIVWIFLIVGYFNQWGDNPASLAGVIFVSIIFIIAILTCYCFNVKINDKHITIRMGIGFIRKRIALSQIEKCEIVRNKWWYGWGYKLGPSFVLYNISGFKAIELSLKRRKEKIRIGTNEPEKLKEVIDEMIS